ncbi:MAG: hypothetical protein ABIO45_06285 [Burkholderiaceae bacterium]
MSIESLSTNQPVRPGCPQPTFAEKTVMALSAVLVSSALLGGMLSMFEMRSEATAMARAAVLTAPSAGGLALRKITSGSRG